jgi:hypothetical protein
MHREPGLLETGDAAINELTLERQFERKLVKLVECIALVIKTGSCSCHECTHHA